MPARTIIAKNNTGSDITLKDLGVVVPASSNLTLTEILTSREITQSQELKTEVTSGDITINDGSNDLSISNGLREIRFETEWEDIEDSESGWVIRETEPFNPQDGKGWLKPGDNNTLYVFNEDKNKMLSADRIYLTFQKQGTADAEYLKIGNVQSTNVGYKPNRNGTIVGATIRITGGYNEKKFFIRDTGNPIDELQLPAANSLVEDLDIDFDSTALLQICVCEEGIPREDWYNQNWKYRIKITIDYTKVSGSSNLTNFPVLISLVNSNLSKARSDGYDILFTASDGETKLDHEIESFTQGTGTLVAWVRIPSLSYTADTEIYIYYGYASSTNQQNVTGVWNSNYMGVWHFNNNLEDSTSNNNDGNNNGTSDITGKIADGRDFERSDTEYINVPDSASLELSDVDLVTVQAWINKESTPSISWMALVQKSDQSYNLQLQNAELPYFTIYDTTWNSAIADGNIVNSQWVYLAGTFDGSTIRLYVDGVLQTITDTASSINSASGTDVGIGENLAATGRHFDGQIDEVRISNIARSGDWIATEYSNQNNPSTFYSLGTEETPTTTATVENPLVELEIAWRQ